MIAFTFNTGIQKYLPFYEKEKVLASKVIVKGPRLSNTQYNYIPRLMPTDGNEVVDERLVELILGPKYFLSNETLEEIAEYFKVTDYILHIRCRNINDYNQSLI